jgi:DNA-binding transcriptional LysR family regulator
MLGDDLEYFLAVASTGNFTGTAQRLGISQPALSKAVQRLEKKVGVTLLVRTPRGAVLTEAGRAFRERLQTVALDLEGAIAEARDIGGGHAGLLRIGVTPATTDFSVHALLPTLAAERPAALISFTTVFAAGLIDAVIRREVELAICPVPLNLDPALECEPLYDDPCSLMFNNAHPLARQDSISFEDLASHAWAGTKKHEFTRTQVELLFAERGLAPPPLTVEADTLNALVLVVSRSPLISMINTRGLRKESLPGNIVIRQMAFPGMERRIGMLRRTGYLSPIAQRARDLLRAAGRS